MCLKVHVFEKSCLRKAMCSITDECFSVWMVNCTNGYVSINCHTVIKYNCTITKICIKKIKQTHINENKILNCIIKIIIGLPIKRIPDFPKTYFFLKYCDSCFYASVLNKSFKSVHPSTINNTHLQCKLQFKMIKW